MTETPGERVSGVLFRDFMMRHYEEADGKGAEETS
jgi:hypothetical protein